MLLYFSVNDSQDFDTGLLSFDAWDDVYWRDTRLTWNFCSNPEVRVTRDKVWLPQVFIYFGYEKINHLMLNVPTVHLESMCTRCVRYFWKTKSPSQNCLVVQSNLYKEPPLGVAKLAVIHRWLSY